MPFVLGIDSSTQSTKVEVRDLESGDLVAAGRGPHAPTVPPISEQHPDTWWQALRIACRKAIDAGGFAPADVVAISVAAQQHGLVALDADGRPVHPAKLWNDTESAPDADRLVAEQGAEQWASATGSVPVAAFTVTKVAWLARSHPEALRRVAHLLLPHDWLTYQLTGRFVTDRGDASGTGYWCPTDGQWRPELLALATGTESDRWVSTLPTVLGPSEAAGTLTASGADFLGLGGRNTVVAAGTGDNMAAALGLGMRTGDVAISLGTSGTAYAVATTATADSSGAVAGFADATGGFLPLVCTLNATLATEAVARWLGVDIEMLDRLASEEAQPGAAGVTFLPYLAGERTPNRPNATGAIAGLRVDTSAASIARAGFEGVVCGLLDGVDALAAAGVPVSEPDGRRFLLGGGSRSRTYRQVTADLLQRTITVPVDDEHVARGACVQAAMALRTVASEQVLEAWPVPEPHSVRPDAAIDAAAIRHRYAQVRGH